MEIIKKQEGTALRLEIVGRLDTVTSPELEQALTASLDSVTELTLDFAQVAYVSSAGLRVLLSAQKLMNTQGSMKVCHVAPEVIEVFEITGFVDVLTIE